MITHMDSLALGKCERYSMAVTYMYIIICIKYLLRLLQMPINRYSQQGYKILRSLVETTRLLYEHGFFGFVWVANCVGIASRFISQLKIYQSKTRVK